jgi:hypothetical protein
VTRERTTGLRFNLELLPALSVLLFAGLGAALPALGVHAPSWLSSGERPFLSDERRFALLGGAFASALAVLLHLFSAHRLPAHARAGLQSAASLLAGSLAARLAPAWASAVAVYTEPGATSRSFGGRGRGVIRLGGSESDERLVELVHELAHLEASHPRKRLFAMLASAWALLLLLVLAQPLVTGAFERELRNEGVLDDFRLIFDVYLVPIALVLAWPLAGFLRNLFHAQEFSADRALAPLTQSAPQLLRAHEQVLRQHPSEQHFPFDSHPSADDRLEALRGGAGSDAGRYLGAVHSFAAVVIALSLGLVGLLTNLLWVRVLAVDRSVRALNEGVREIQRTLGKEAGDVRDELTQARQRTAAYEKLLGLGAVVGPKEAGSFPQLARDLHALHQRLLPLDEQVDELGRDLGLDGERPGAPSKGLRLLRDQLQVVQPGLESYGQGLGLLPAQDGGRIGLLPGLSQRLTELSAPTGPLASVEKALGSYLEERGPYVLLWNRTKDLADRLDRAGHDLGLPAAGSAEPVDGGGGGAPLQRLESALGGLASSLETVRGQLARDGGPLHCPDWRRLDRASLDAEIRKLPIADRVACLDQLTAEALEAAAHRAQDSLPPQQRPKAGPQASPADAGVR